MLSNIKTIDEHAHAHAHAPMDERCELDTCQVFTYNQNGSSYFLLTFNFLFKMVHHTPTTMIKT